MLYVRFQIQEWLSSRCCTQKARDNWGSHLLPKLGEKHSKRFLCFMSRTLIRLKGCLLQSRLRKGHQKVINNPDNSLEPGKKSIKLASTILDILAEFVSRLGPSKRRSTVSALLNCDVSRRPRSTRHEMNLQEQMVAIVQLFKTDKNVYTILGQGMYS